MTSRPSPTHDSCSHELCFHEQEESDSKESVCRITFIHRCWCSCSLFRLICFFHNHFPHPITKEHVNPCLCRSQVNAIALSKRTLNSKTNTPPRKVNWNILDAEKLILEANLHTERKRQLHIIRRIIIRQALCVGIKHKLDVLLPRTIASRNLDGVTHQLYDLTPLCLYYARTAFHRE